MNLTSVIDAHLASMTDDEVRVLLLFHRVGQEGARLKMAYDEATLRTGVPVSRIEPALDALEKRGLVTKKKKHVYTFDTNAGYVFDLTFATSKDEDALEDIVNRNNQLTRIIEDMQGETCGLGEALPDSVGRVFRLAETIVHRGLNSVEIFYLTELISRFGIDRTIRALQDARKSREPLKAAYQMLKRGRLGKSFEQKTEPENRAEYVPLDNLDPWGTRKGART